MRIFGRIGACLLVLIAVVISIGETRAACGVANFVSAGVFGGGTGTMTLYNAAPPYDLQAAGSIPLTTDTGRGMFQVAVAGAAATPPKYMMIVSPSCTGCAVPASNLCGNLNVVVLFN